MSAGSDVILWSNIVKTECFGKERARRTPVWTNNSVIALKQLIFLAKPTFPIKKLFFIINNRL